ncbi:MAG: protein kinase domain-containing protein [Acidimicrobiia bacterium]
METLAPDRVLGGRYRLRRELARGGMATVWEADDRVLTRRVAIKVLHPHLAGDDGFRMRFRREAVAAAGLAHPHIVTTYDTGRDSDLAYIVMELVQGITLGRLLRSGGPLPVAKAVDIAAQVADALACAHAHGIVHRDVKPANILLRPDGHVKVADFGIAKAGASDDLTRTGVVMGTAKYLSPEQVSGRPAEARSDVYALGIVLYEMLIGQVPFVGDTELSTAVARLTASPEGLRERRPDVPPGLEAVVLRSLARHPEERFGTAEEMRSGLLAVAHPAEDTMTPPAGVAVPPPPRRLGAKLATVAGVVTLLAGSAALLVGRDSESSGRRLSAGGGVEQRPRSRPQPVPLATPVPFDPQGDDGTENDDTAGLLVDNDPATAWKSDTYNSQFGEGYKDGVGVYFDMTGPQAIRSVDVETMGQAGWTAEVYVSDRLPGALAGWGDPKDSGTGPFELSGAQGRYVLVWFTSLPEVEGGYRVEVAEVSINRA